jgi:NADH-quinone oxidoreductase subunit J
MFILLFSLFLILVQNNPVYSVFSFILVAFIVFTILLVVGAEFFALIILIIYTGVITVLFLFVIIMYNLRVTRFTEVSVWYSVFLVLLIYKLTWFSLSLLSIFGPNLRLAANFLMYTADVTHFIGLFNGHFLLFFFCGLLIFIAMIGSVVLTASFFKYYK